MRAFNSVAVPLISVAFAVSLFGGCSSRKDKHEDEAPVNPVQPGTPIPIDVVWAVKDDASSSQLMTFSSRIQTASSNLWNATQGKMYLRNVTLIDKTQTGQVILDNLTLQSAQGSFAYTIKYSDDTWEIHLGGNYPMQAWMHEIGHAEVLQDWTLPEEYDLGSASNCSMGAYILGSGEGRVVYCDSANCLTSRNGCWQNVILLTHPGWTYPEVFGVQPSTVVTITNN